VGYILGYGLHGMPKKTKLEKMLDILHWAKNFFQLMILNHLLEMNHQFYFLTPADHDISVSKT
jgi:hypothetical protein